MWPGWVGIPCGSLKVSIPISNSSSFRVNWCTRCTRTFSNVFLLCNFRCWATNRGQWLRARARPLSASSCPVLCSVKNDVVSRRPSPSFVPVPALHCPASGRRLTVAANREACRMRDQADVADTQSAATATLRTWWPDISDGSTPASLWIPPTLPSTRSSPRPHHQKTQGITDRPSRRSARSILPVAGFRLSPRTLRLVRCPPTTYSLPVFKQM